ncbi:nicotinate-nucleotide adenylyltransferase [Candidatus Photodesmus katoptron]|uniref:nicotinate-nicotinamide nucleotide adenylyltransferase n=1 Tax=Candidatus Photodesmus anomalopis TaxID=28176 RepID=UPI0004D36F3E|nr:nicotinate-nicotinamide nucleotide adenylyltransferase [Candidatus Photodesmus katoptron]KEY90463.1 nicotinate-nucleotide adenylyltransferase [Candidatus Photodesmus katoptron]
MRKIAAFGSAFNPPSLGHKSIITSLNHFDKILLIPSIYHPFGKKMINYQVRCQLVDAFITDINLLNVERSKIEEKLLKIEKPVKTYTLLLELSNEFPESDITFVLGPDNLLNFPNFYKSEEILKYWNILICPERISIRSSDIRQKLANGLNIDDLTTPSVLSLLKETSAYSGRVGF